MVDFKGAEPANGMWGIAALIGALSAMILMLMGVNAVYGI